MTPALDELAEVADRVVAAVRRSTHNDDENVEANVLVHRSRHGLTRFANSFIHQNVTEDTVTVLVTLAVDGRTTTLTTTALDDDALDRIVADTVDQARRQPVDPHWPGATPTTVIDSSADTGPASVLAGPASASADPETVSAGPDTRARGVKGFVDAGQGLASAGYLDTEATWAAFASTAGHRARGASTRATIDGIQQTETGAAGAGHQTSRAVGALDPADTGRRAAELAFRGEARKDIDPGEFEVVLGPEAVASMLLFLGVYGFNAKSHLEGSSFAHVGEQQFDPAFTLIEAPDDPRAIGLPFDAQGCPRQRLTLVDRGITRALVHDRRTAARARTNTTGNAMPGGEAYGAIPMNLTLVPGSVQREEMIAGMRRGLVITQFHYCRILDPKTQVVTGLTRNGTFLVVDGRIRDAVANLRFTQSFLDALAPGNILGVGDDDRYADAEFGPGMVITPSLHLARWRFTGGAEG